MDAELIAAAIEAMIPFCAGVYCSLLGFKVVGKAESPALQARWEAWHAKWGRLCQIVGPIVALSGVFLFVARWWQNTGG